MNNPKTKFSISVPDQFEIEPVESYYKSYTDRVYLPTEEGQTTVSSLGRKRKIVKFHSVKNGFFDSNTMPDGYVTKLRNLAPLFGPGFLLQRFSIDHIVYDLSGTPVTASINSRAMNIIESASLIPKENITSPSQNLVVKLFCEEEQFTDTALPRPADIVQLNGGKFVEGNAEFYHPGSFLYPNLPSFDLITTTFGVKNTPKKFKFILGSSNPHTVVTNSQDSTVVSDNIWFSSFPFENKYKDLPKFYKPDFGKNYRVTMTQSILGGFGDLIVKSQSNSYEANEYSIQWCFSTIGEPSSSALAPSWHNRRRYITLLDVPVVVSSTITKVVVKPTGNLIYPDVGEVYKGFYGVYHKNNDETTPYFNAIESLSGSYEYGGGGWRFGANANQIYNPFAPNYISTIGIQDSLEQAIEKNKLRGWRSHERYFGTASVDPNPLDNRVGNIGKFPIHPYMAGYTAYGSIQQRSNLNTNLVSALLNYYPTEDFNIHYLRLTGWKYGVYHALPCYSNCYFRRGKYGMFRDMLEQRVNTKFIKISKNSNQNNSRIENLGASVAVAFVTSSNAFVTASNQSLNTRDSGIYDVEARSGQPFNDR